MWGFLLLDQAVEDLEHGLDFILTDSCQDSSIDEADAVPSSVSSEVSLLI